MAQKLSYQFGNKLYSIFLWIGVSIPAILTLYFIFQFGVTTVINDEWKVVSNLGLFFSGGDWLQGITTNQNEHIPFFPQLIILSMAYFNSYNLFVQILVGWMFLSLTLLVLWLLLRQTVPEAKWVIIPLSWLNYSLAAYSVNLWGYTSIHVHLAIFAGISAIYFLNKIKYSFSSIFLAIFFIIIGTFSFLAGLYVWFIGWLSIRDFKSRSIFFIYLIAGITILVVYYLSITPVRSFGKKELALPFEDPISWVSYVLAYLGNSPNLLSLKFWPEVFRNNLSSFDPLLFAMSIGATILATFMIMNLLNFRFHVRNNLNRNITPWLQIAFFGLISAMVTAFGRLEFGTLQALAPRYVPFSNLFLEGTVVIGCVVFFSAIKKTKTKKNRTILLIIFYMLLFFLFLHIALAYIEGWVWGEVWSNHYKTSGEGVKWIAPGVPSECLLNFENASDGCLKKLWPSVDPLIVRERASILKEYCLGPFADNCP